MAKVTNHRIERQTGSEGLISKWDFENTQKITESTGAISVGDYVNVKSGATWYNGSSIPSFVFTSGPWHVDEIRGDRVVLGKNQSGTNNIQSPINLSNLESTTSGGETTTAEVDTLDHFSYQWFYQTGDDVWYEGDGGATNSTETTSHYTTYTPPDNWVVVHCHVLPIAKVHKVNGQDTAYWTGDVSIAGINKTDTGPEVPPTPSVEIDNYTLTATVDNITDARTDEINFEVYDMEDFFTSGNATVRAAMASFSCSINAGGSYRVRARAANLLTDSTRIYSDWTPYTSVQSSIPSAPSEITTIRATSSTSVYLEWTIVNSADTYSIEYTTNVRYFDGSNETTTIDNIEFNHYEVTGLESGSEYFFRVSASNSMGKSGWTEPKSVIIGKAPSAPTTWSSTTTVMVGDTLNLYWVHNSEDGSKERYAQIELTIGGNKETKTIDNPEFDDEEAEETIHHYSVDTSRYAEGTTIEWRVRTAGVTSEWGDWSVMRTVDIYAPPTLSLSVTDQNGISINVLTSFPLYIKAVAGPNTQRPIGYSVTIAAQSGYTSVDDVGRNVIVTAGELVYNKYFDTDEVLLAEISAGDVSLQDGIEYLVSVTVSMDSGLTASASQIFTVSWTDDVVPLDMQIAIDKQSLVAYVTPYSRNPETGELNAGYELMVYRREFDGTFTLISDGLDSSLNTVVTDPHPALDYARYRIVARSNATGTISYYDPPGYPVGCTSIIIQWDEDWTNFDVTNTDERMQPPWTGSLLELKYNVDISDSISPEVEFVDYIGRSYPVSYYGTKVDSTSSWSTEIPYYDKDTIYALRRLQIWKGDCYVREPTGSGYWASIVVSFTKTHCELTIPITIDITRVSGGI